MKTTFALAVALAALALAGCERSIKLPDGGQGPVNCDPNAAPTTLSVKVVYKDGSPVAGADVTATNQALNRQAKAQTNAQGVTNAIDQSIGEGTVTLQATVGTTVSDVQQTSWTCGECSCTVQPPSVTLTLQQ